MIEQTELVVDVISDVVCPWCFLGMKRLEHAARLVDNVAVRTRWRPYQLDRDIPAGGLPRHAYMLGKFGSEERLHEAHTRLAELGELEGIRFNFADIAVAPNTLDTHRMIRWAGSPKAPAGAQTQMVRRLFELYFEEARDIGDHAVLVEAAGECGLDAALIEALLASNADVEDVRKEIATASEMGVTGVPCFIFEGKYAVVGAQEADTLADAIRQIAGAKVRGELPTDA